MILYIMCTESNKCIDSDIFLSINSVIALERIVKCTLDLCILHYAQPQVLRGHFRLFSFKAKSPRGISACVLHLSVNCTAFHVEVEMAVQFGSMVIKSTVF